MQANNDQGSGWSVAVPRIVAVRYLIKPQRLRESVTIARQPSTKNSALAGLQACAAAAITLPAVYSSSWKGLIGYASLGTLAALFGRFAPLSKRGSIVFWCALLQTLMVFTMSLAAWIGVPQTGQIFLLALACGFFFIVSIAGQFGPPGALIFIFAGSVAMGRVDSFQVVMERTLATGVAALLAWFICVTTERLRESVESANTPNEPVRPLSHRVIATARIIAGTAAAAYAAHFSGVQHPGWAAMGALAVMQGAHLHITMNRAIQRMVGTVIGAMVVYMILAQAPSVWVVIPLLLLLTLATEMIIGINYGLGQILVTPMALLMGYLALPGAAAAAVVQARVLDTLIGVTIGVILAVVFSTLDDRNHLARHHGQAL
jgi:hypothetical protein